MASSDLEIVVGTYENLILGYKVKDSITKGQTLESSFTDDSHRGALRCLAISPSGVLASSSTDDSIRLHNLRKRKEIGGLFEHSGTVNRIQFFPGSHMFTASEDGTICMWKCKNWEVMKTLKGHRSHVNSFAVHPSGKLGLSVGNDRSFLTWDLVTGKLAFQRKLQEAAQDVLFTALGDHYALVYNKKIEVCSLADTQAVKEIETDWRINAVCPLQNNTVAIGGDSRDVLITDLLTGKTLLKLDAASANTSDFNSRVRAICKTEFDSSLILVIGTASGNVKVFKLQPKLKKDQVEMVLHYESKVRMTCMTVFNNSVGSSHEDKSKSVKTNHQKNGKRKVEDVDDDDENEDGGGADGDHGGTDDENKSDNENKECGGDSNETDEGDGESSTASPSKMFPNKKKKKESDQERIKVKSSKKRKLNSASGPTQKQQRKGDLQHIKKLGKKKNKRKNK